MTSGLSSGGDLRDHVAADVLDDTMGAVDPRPPSGRQHRSTPVAPGTSHVMSAPWSAMPMHATPPTLARLAAGGLSSTNAAPNAHRMRGTGFSMRAWSVEA
ncbi:hypothetical protein SAMN06893097_11223 [Geodermatophilus sabuli]|uniref:Uncharacterized protein n=1 Tax=Geodermatophilus sabuli TaxID=1564158 RepID=A0A285EHX7_9ACTN|nr:hypothetical protein SAMN06893097_11223 [Geodermatophilus sabuli]